jgi:hypothetical protein
MARRTTRTTAGQYTWVWMIVALVLIAAFVAWLAVASEPTGVAVREGPAEDTGGVTTVPGGELGLQPGNYLGEPVRLEGLQVASRLGAQAFWVELPTQPQPRPFLIKLDTALVRQGFAVQSGQRLNVTGQVHAMTDSVIRAWQEIGAVRDDAESGEAQFATHFLEANRITPAAAAGPQS